MTTLLGGFKDRKIESRSKVEPSTAQYIGRYRQGQDTLSQISYFSVGTDVAESGSTDSAIIATGIESVARVGDVIRLTSGSLSGDIAFVQSVSTNSVTLSQKLNSAVGVGDTFSILRPTIVLADSTGAISVNVTTPATVNQGTPAASGTGWRITEYGPTGLSNFYWNIFGLIEIPTVVVGDPNTGSPWNFISNRGCVQFRSTTSGHVSVAASTSNVTLLGDQPVRSGASIYNDSTANLYLKLGATASTSSFTTIVRPNQLYEVPFGYTGIIDGLWSAATGNARIMECY